MQIRLSDHFSFGRLLRFTLPSIAMMILTSLYSEVRIIMAMLGSVKRSRRPKEKWSDSLICIKTSV